MLILHDHRIPREYLDAITRKLPGASFLPFTGPSPEAPMVYDSIFSHPDIYFFQIDAGTLVHAPGAPENVLSALRRYGVELIEGGKDPSGKYPDTALYNAARAGRVVFHHSRCTDRVLADTIRSRGYGTADVPQGYCACSIVPAGKRALVTADEGIAREAEMRGFKALIVSRGHVGLPGERYGFLGGACGVMPDDGILFLGDITRHPDGDAIISFLTASRANVVSLEGLPLLDAGRLIMVENRE